MRYEGPVYRPPSEAGSLVIQATVGCPHNRCAFCGMYRDRRFRRRPVSEVIEDLDQALERFGPGVRTVFLADGNCAALATDRLVELGDAVRSRFPGIERITLYGSARFLIRKSRQEWERIRAAGIRRVHSGLESGDPVTLEQLCKGVTPDEAVEAFNHLMAAGVELSVYLMVGVAGLERWSEHADGSADVLNRASPDFVRLRTYIPIPGTPWHARWRSGELTLPSAHEALRETRRLVSQLHGPTTLTSDHISNFLDVHGSLPDQREEMLGSLDEAMAWPLTRFRPPTERLVGWLSL